MVDKVYFSFSIPFKHRIFDLVCDKFNILLFGNICLVTVVNKCVLPTNKSRSQIKSKTRNLTFISQSCKKYDPKHVKFVKHATCYVHVGTYPSFLSICRYILLQLVTACLSNSPLAYNILCYAYTTPHALLTTYVIKCKPFTN